MGEASSYDHISLKMWSSYKRAQEEYDQVEDIIREKDGEVLKH